MPDVIQLLSDHIANQIAAGEVIQRPASAVKELLENAIDAGATEIQLVIKDAGKELVQVIDNGKGMSPTDARMSFERHATSKIRNIDDLFTIRTMGFRGEALASIAAVAQVELKTRLQDNEVGTRLCIEATEVKVQEAAAVPVGTNISVKNLFFNVPARRHFLKTNTTEFRHILDEFTRIALSYPKIAFRLWHNGVEQFHLESSNLKTRIKGLMGNSYERKLVAVEEQTELIRITGFIGNPEAAAKTRGMQYFFINNRFIRNSYLHHAVMTAYEGLIEKESFPFYVLFLEMDPTRVDVNVHPTKQEVKFDDDKMMYAYLQAAVKHALARNNIAPSLDFEAGVTVTQLPSTPKTSADRPAGDLEKNYLYHTFSQKNQAHFIERGDSLSRWKQLYEVGQPTSNPFATSSNPFPPSNPFPKQEIPKAPEPVTPQRSIIPEEAETTVNSGKQNILLVQGSMLITTVRSGLMLIHIRRAQERIWYERLLQQWNVGVTPSQQVLFPVSYELPPQDGLLLMEVLSDLARIGFDISPFGKNTFVVHGVPTDLPNGEEKNVLDEVLDQLKHESPDATITRTERILSQLARRLSRNKHAIQQPEGQQALIDELFACSNPEYTPDGKKVFMMIRKEMLDGMLG